MWRLLAFGLVVAGCTDHGVSPEPQDGELLGVQRGGGFCQPSFACNGSVTFTDIAFVARLGNTTVATGSIGADTLAAIDLAVAKIPADTPSTIPDPNQGGCDSGPTTFDVVVRGDSHSYTHQCALGALAPLSTAFVPVMSAIVTCTATSEVTLATCIH